MVSVVNSQQIPPRETLASAKKSTTSPDFYNYSLHNKHSKAVEDNLELYGQLRDTIKSSASNVHAARSTRSSSRTTNRPQSVNLLERNARLPSLRLYGTGGERGGPRSASAPSMRSVDSLKSSRFSDLESVHEGTREREIVPRHLTASAPLVRSGFAKDKSEGFDEGEFALPERRLQNYETLRGYIATNGEASLSRIVTSSIGASHKFHSPPSSPHHFGRLDDRKKRPKPKRAFEEPRKSTKPIYKDHRFSMDSLANNLEDIINGTNRPHTADITKSISTIKRPSTAAGVYMNEDSDNEYPPSTSLAASATEPTQGRIRTRNANDAPVRNITFNLSPAGD